jgi:integrase
MKINRNQDTDVKPILNSIPDPILVETPVFATVAQQYYEMKCSAFAGRHPEKQALRLQMILEKYCLPSLADIPMTKLKTGDVLQVLKPIWKEKTAVAERVRVTISRIFEMTQALGICRDVSNPADWSNNLEFFLPRPSAAFQLTYPPAINYRELPRFFRVSRSLDSTQIRALEVMVLTAARADEVRTALWSEFDIKKRLWRIPASKIRYQRNGWDHMVPIPERVIEILESQPRSETDAVFPGLRGRKFLVESALNNAIKRVHQADLENGGPGFFDPETGRVATAFGMRRAFRAFALEEASASHHLVKLALSQLDEEIVKQSPILVQEVSKRRMLMEQFAQYVLSLDNGSRE